MENIFDLLVVVLMLIALCAPAVGVAAGIRDAALESQRQAMERQKDKAALAEAAREPAASLLRASSVPGTHKDQLVRPAIGQDTSDPAELLRAQNGNEL